MELTAEEAKEIKDAYKIKFQNLNDAIYKNFDEMDFDNTIRKEEISQLFDEIRVICNGMVLFLENTYFSY